MREALMEFFINSQMSYLSAFVWLIIGMTFAFIIGKMDTRQIKVRRESKRTIKRLTVDTLNKIARRVCNEMNDAYTISSRACNIYGEHYNVRVFISCKVKIKRDFAVFKFYLESNDKTKASWGKFEYPIHIEGCSAWREFQVDQYVEDIVSEYSRVINRY